MSTGDKIKAARQAAGMTQREIADILGTTQQNFYQYEKGLRIPKIPTLKRIAAALGTDITSIMDKEDYSPYDLDISQLYYGGPPRRVYGDLFPLVDAYDLLNREGKKVAVARVRELTEIPRYRNTYTDGPETAPADDD